MKFGGRESLQTGGNADDFGLKQQVVELFEHIRSVKAGEIRTLEIRYGLPFSMEVPLDGTVNTESSRETSVNVFGAET